MTAPRVAQVTAADLHPLRQRVLRPHQSVAEVGFEGDDHPDAGHFAALLDDEVVAVASVLVERHPDRDDGRAWRLRGMATDPLHRGQGWGALLVRAVVVHVADRGGGLLWCNARVPAEGFYARLGFVAEDVRWEEPDLGPHVRMHQHVEPA